MKKIISFAKKVANFSINMLKMVRFGEYVMLFLAALIVLSPFFSAKNVEAKSDTQVIAADKTDINILKNVKSVEIKEPIKSKTRKVIVTAYSSTPDQTDSTPFITAMGTRVRDGIVATNFLPFGSKVKFPTVFGDKVFVVEDRMALKNSHKIDIWFPTRQEALNFGVKFIEVEIL